jgi:hypothetical protein
MGVRKMEFLNNQNAYEVLDKLDRFVCLLRSGLSIRKKENCLHDCAKIHSEKGGHFEQGLGSI